MKVKNSGCIVVGVRGSLMGIRIANKRNRVLGRKQGQWTKCPARKGVKSLYWHGSKRCGDERVSEVGRWSR
jgi:hypothetical protein